MESLTSGNESKKQVCCKVMCASNYYLDITDKEKNTFKNVKTDMNEESISKNLEKHILRDLKRNFLRKSDHFKQSVFKEIQRVKENLKKPTVEDLLTEYKRRSRKRISTGDESSQIPMFLYDSWRYQTPPRKDSLNVFLKEESDLKPAIISKYDNKKIIYEFNEIVNLELYDCKREENLTIDNKHVTAETRFQIEEYSNYPQISVSDSAYNVEVDDYLTVIQTRITGAAEKCLKRSRDILEADERFSANNNFKFAVTEGLKPPEKPFQLDMHNILFEVPKEDRHQAEAFQLYH